MITTTPTQTSHQSSAEDKLTRQQQKALHVWYGLLADELNRNGKSMALVLQKFVLDVPATKYTIKELVWKPLQQAMFGKESTTQLLKKQEIDQVYDALCKFFAEDLEVEVPPFPSVEENIFNETYGRTKNSNS